MQVILRVARRVLRPTTADVATDRATTEEFESRRCQINPRHRQETGLEGGGAG